MGIQDLKVMCSVCTWDYVLHHYSSLGFEYMSWFSLISFLGLVN